MSLTADEIQSQPTVWRQALATRGDDAAILRRDGEDVLVIGCGTSAFVAESFAQLRERAGLGRTDAAYASEPRLPRSYDTLIAISRSGTTTEVIEALDAAPADVHRMVVTGVADSPVAARADEVLLLDFADEHSVVQTRFPTTFLLLARHAFGEDVAGLADQAEEALAAPTDPDAAAREHFVYLGSGWTHGLAQEAALKIREAAQAWSESYPLLDYRHGPIAVAGPRSLVWLIGAAEPRLADDIRAVGARVEADAEQDPLVALVRAQQLAVAVAAARGLDPDVPRHLTRSVVLT